MPYKWRFRIFSVLTYLLFFFGSMGLIHSGGTGYWVCMLVGAAGIVASFIFIMVMAVREERAAREARARLQAEREADPEWAEYQRLRAKFFDDKPVLTP